MRFRRQKFCIGTLYNYIGTTDAVILINYVYDTLTNCKVAVNRKK